MFPYFVPYRSLNEKMFLKSIFLPKIMFLTIRNASKTIIPWFQCFHILFHIVPFFIPSSIIHTIPLIMFHIVPKTQKMFLKLVFYILSHIVPFFIPSSIIHTIPFLFLVCIHQGMFLKCIPGYFPQTVVCSISISTFSIV